MSKLYDFYFFTTLHGVGETPEKAWEDVVESLSSDPGYPPSDFVAYDNDNPNNNPYPHIWDSVGETYTISQKVQVQWVRLGEGNCGSYNPDDPEDVELLRFDVYFWNDELNRFVQPQDASYCSQVSASVSEDKLIELSKHIAVTVQDSPNKYKRLLEQLSWLSDKEDTNA